MIEHNKIRGETVYRRTYSRPTNEEGTKFEEWDDTIARVIKHQQWLWERAKGSGLDETEFIELEGLKVLLLSRKCSLSGRTLWLGGTETAKKREASQFNCAGLTLKTINDVVDQIWLLMQGCGTGFHPEVGILNGFTKKIDNIEVIRSELNDTIQNVDANIESYSEGIWTIKVGDSAEAWAKTFGKLLAGKYAADKLVFDFSNIRPAGERLKGYGWISSGDSSMAIALPAIAEILNKRAGQLLTRIDLLDIGNWMGTVLSSRRSAEIAFHRFGDPEWEDFAKAKMNIQEDGNVQRYQSNNSLLFYQKPSKLELRGIFEMMVEAGGSEPGFINAEEALRRAAWFRLLNPCLLGSTSVIIKEGASSKTVPLKLVNVGDEIWSKEGWSTVTHFFDRGLKQVNDYKTTAGRLSATPEHKIDFKGEKIEIAKAQGIDILLGPTPEESSLNSQDILDGLVIGDGTQQHTHLLLCIGEKDQDYYTSEIARYIGDTYSKDYQFKVNTTISCEELPHTYDREVPSRFKYSSPETKRGFLRGLFSANGSVLFSGSSRLVQLKQSSYELIVDIQGMLHSLGINCYVCTNKATKTKHANGTYTSKESYTLRINARNCVKFAALIGFIQQYKQVTLQRVVDFVEAPTSTIRKVSKGTFDIVKSVDIGEHNVYDITVDNESHTFWADGFSVSNCAEILLGDSSFCNLVETNLSAFNGDEKALREAIYLIGRANYRQTCVNLKDGILQDTWHELNEFLRLTGMGVTGIVDWEYCEEAEKWQQLRALAQESVNSMANDLGLPRSKAVTTVKPSGTLSKMMGCKEGIHQSMGKYIFNNIIFSVSDPLVSKLVDANYDTMEHPNDPQSIIVTFPVLWEGEGFKTIVKNGLELEINTDSAIVQLERYKMVMENYVDHNCSITISYGVEEIPEIVNWLFDNWDYYVGVSWLFRVDPTITAEEIGYPYLPQEVKTKDEWYTYADSLVPFSFKNTETLEELDGTEECVGGVCPVR